MAIVSLCCELCLAGEEICHAQLDDPPQKGKSSLQASAYATADSANAAVYDAVAVDQHCNSDSSVLLYLCQTAHLW